MSKKTPTKPSPKDPFPQTPDKFQTTCQQVQKNQVVHLDFSCKWKNSNFQVERLGEDQIKNICSDLTKNESVTSLKLKHNNLQSTGFQYVSNLLSSTQKIKELDLGHNKIDEKNMKILSDGLKKNTVLKDLSLFRKFTNNAKF